MLNVIYSIDVRCGRPEVESHWDVVYISDALGRAPEDTVISATPTPFALLLPKEDTRALLSLTKSYARVDA